MANTGIDAIGTTPRGGGGWESHGSVNVEGRSGSYNKQRKAFGESQRVSPLSRRPVCRSENHPKV